MNALDWEREKMESGQSLQLNGKQSRTVRLKVSPKADFRDVLRTLREISIPPTRVSDENIRFAILELLNNSIRAHREKGEPRDICLDLTVSEGRLVIAIRDFGGGFDPEKLPYNLHADPSTLDLRSTPFEEYQRSNGYKRFGMGIYVAKKTFDDFRVVFLDGMDRPASWMPGRVIGTLITLSVKMEMGDTPAPEAADAVQREDPHGQ
jgi:anti-sigma regulatory factor (Ser/Thr protein kinase)